MKPGTEWRKLAAKAVAAGWRKERLRNSHFRFTPPDPTVSAVVCSASPSDRRAFLQFRADMRRSGLDV